MDFDKVEDLVKFRIRNLELYSTTSGSFGESAKEKLLIKIPANKFPNRFL